MGNRSSFMLQDEEITLISEETGFSATQIEKLYSRFTALDKSGIGSLSRQDFLAIPELAINPLCDRIVQMFFNDCDEDHERINFRRFMNVLSTFRLSHKSSPLSRSRNASRQESLNQQAPLLFDSIDPSAFSSLARHHSRHSSYHDGFLDAYQHHSTNQHSVHYAASTTHLPSQSNGIHHQHHPNHHHHNHFHNPHHHLHNSLSHSNSLASIAPDEPSNSKKQKLYFMFKLYDVNNDNIVDLEDLKAILKMMVGNYVDDSRIHRIAERTLRETDKNCFGFIDFDQFCSTFSRRDIDELLKVKFSNSYNKD